MTAERPTVATLAWAVESEVDRWATRTVEARGTAWTVTSTTGERVELLLCDDGAILTGTGWDLETTATTPHAVVIEAFRGAARSIGADAL